MSCLFFLSFFFLKHTSLRLFVLAWAAIAKYHRLGGLNNKHSSFGGWEVQDLGAQRFGSCEDSSWLDMSPHCVLTCPHCSLFFL